MCYDRKVRESAIKVKLGGWSEMRTAIQEHARSVMEAVLKAELEEYLGCRYHERSEKRLQYANGYYTRSLSTSFGCIEGFHVPRPRQGGFPSVLFGQYQRRAGELDRSLLVWYLQGESCRDVKRSLEAWCGDRLSAQGVSRVIQSVDEELRSWRCRELPKDLSAVWLDGFSVKVRVKHKVRPCMILMALGRHANGRWEVLGFRLTDIESEGRWGGLLEQMRARGMRSALFVHDGAAGIEKALRRAYPGIKTQRCLVHKLRNILDVLMDERHAAEIRHDFWLMYDASDKDEAYARYITFCRKWARKEPAAVRIAKGAWLSTVTHLEEGDAELRTLYRSTNVIELFYRELRRRVKVIGAFPTPQSAERIAFMAVRYIESVTLNKSQNMASLLDQFTQN